MIKIAIKAAKEAGKILMKYYGKEIKVKYKTKYFEPSSILTEADIKAEEKIVNILKKNFPKHNIYSEEKLQEKKGSNYTWYVDPLDGTSNFSRNIPIFGISIGLVKEKQPILGVLYFPALKLLVYAEKDKGVFANGKKVHVSSRKLKESLYFSKSYHQGKFLMEKSIADKVGVVTMIHSGSYDLAQIAIGNGELYMEEYVQHHLHDFIAGIIIVREAKGKVTDYNGNKWDINSKSIIVSNGLIHNQVIKLLKK